MKILINKNNIEFCTIGLDYKYMLVFARHADVFNVNVMERRTFDKYWFTADTYIIPANEEFCLYKYGTNKKKFYKFETVFTKFGQDIPRGYFVKKTKQGRDGPVLFNLDGTVINKGVFATVKDVSLLKALEVIVAKNPKVSKIGENGRFIFRVNDETYLKYSFNEITIYDVARSLDTCGAIQHYEEIYVAYLQRVARNSKFK